MKCSRRRLVSLAGEPAEGVRAPDYGKWGESGIRAQLVAGAARPRDPLLVTAADLSGR